MKMNKFIGQIKLVPGGFKKLFVESKNVVRTVKSVNESSRKLTRREKEMILSNTYSVKKLLLFALLQLPPVVGYVWVFIYFRYPRHLLTHHFWSEEQIREFLSDEYNDRKFHAHHLRNHMKTADIPSTPEISISHMKLLAKANHICNTDLVHNIIPPVVLNAWLKRRAEELISDDDMLREEGLDSLETIELQRACLRRGIDPFPEDETVLRERLARWLQDSHDYKNDVMALLHKSIPQEPLELEIGRDSQNKAD